VRYIHLERIHDGLFRVMVIGDQHQINELLTLLKGHDWALCSDVSEHGHRVRRVQNIDDVVT
jgi:hypothetical protein